jgi:hypothetical protein
LQIHVTYLKSVDLGLLLHHLGFRYQTFAEHIFVDVQELPIANQRFLLLAYLFVKPAYLKVSRRYCRDGDQITGTPISLTGLEVGFLGCDTLANLAPDIRFPNNVGRSTVLSG